MKRVSSGSPWEPVIGFSRAVKVGDRILVSGTAPVWPDGSCDPDPASQMRRCLEIIGEALSELDASLEDVVRTRIYLVDAADADVVGRVHGEVFGERRPAATMVVIKGLLDERWKVELEAEAVLRNPSVVGIEGVIETGLGHLSPEQRKKWSEGRSRTCCWCRTRRTNEPRRVD